MHAWGVNVVPFRVGAVLLVTLQCWKVQGKPHNPVSGTQVNLKGWPKGVNHWVALRLGTPASKWMKEELRRAWQIDKPLVDTRSVV